MVALHDEKKSVTKTPYDRSLCTDVVVYGKQLLPACMTKIDPQMVIQAILSYYDGKILPKEDVMPIHCPKCGNSLEPAEGDLYEPDKPKLQRPTELMASNQVKEQPLDQRELPSAMRVPFEGVRKHVPSVIAHKERVTICVLCYGHYVQLQTACIKSILKTVPREQIDLRIAGNALSEEARQFILEVGANKLYLHDENRYKYPVMREMFYDKIDPIKTEWLIWFDDDSYVKAKSVRWLEKLLELTKGDKIGLIGCPVRYTIRAREANWFREGDWYRGRHFRLKDGKEATNGNYIHYVQGGFWAASMEAIRQSNIPDKRLVHNGGDVTIGEQVWQNGFQQACFNLNHELIYTSSYCRRGYREEYPWRRAYDSAH